MGAEKRINLTSTVLVPCVAGHGEDGVGDKLSGNRHSGLWAVDTMQNGDASRPLLPEWVSCDALEYVAI